MHLIVDVVARISLRVAALLSLALVLLSMVEITCSMLDDLSMVHLGLLISCLFLTLSISRFLQGEHRVAAVLALVSIATSWSIYYVALSKLELAVCTVFTLLLLGLCLWERVRLLCSLITCVPAAFLALDVGPRAAALILISIAIAIWTALSLGRERVIARVIIPLLVLGAVLLYLQPAKTCPLLILIPVLDQSLIKTIDIADRACAYLTTALISTVASWAIASVISSLSPALNLVRDLVSQLKTCRLELEETTGLLTARPSVDSYQRTSQHVYTSSYIMHSSYNVATRLSLYEEYLRRLSHYRSQRVSTMWWSHSARQRVR